MPPCHRGAVSPSAAYEAAQSAAIQSVEKGGGGGARDIRSPVNTCKTWFEGLRPPRQTDCSQEEWSSIEVTRSELTQLSRGEIQCILTRSPPLPVGHILRLESKQVPELWVRVLESQGAACYSAAMMLAANKQWIPQPSLSVDELERVVFEDQRTKVATDVYTDVYLRVLRGQSLKLLEKWLQEIRKPQARTLQITRVKLLPVQTILPSSTGSREREAALPTIDARAVATLPRFHGPQGCMVGRAFIGSEQHCKTIEVRLVSEHLGYLDNRRLAVTALGKGDQFLYSEREESGRTLVLLLELEAEPCIFDSRGHAVAHYQQSAIPATLLRGFDSQFGEPCSINYGNHFYHERIGRGRLPFDPKGALEQAVALQVKLNGVVRRQPTKGGLNGDNAGAALAECIGALAVLGWHGIATLLRQGAD